MFRNRFIFPLIALLGTAAAVAAVWRLGRSSSVSAPEAPVVPSSQPVLRIGITPERDIFQQRHRYTELTEILGARLGRNVQVITAATYDGALKDLADGNVEAAFLGSLVTVLAVDRLHADIVVKVELANGISTYRGVIVAPASSSIIALNDLRHHRLAMVPGTTGGGLFPVFALRRAGIPFSGDDSVQPMLVGTHDGALKELMDGHCDAAAVKDSRLDEFEKQHPEFKFKRLAASEPVPETMLVIRPELSDSVGRQMGEILRHLPDDAAGRSALANFGASRFLPCRINECRAVYDMIDAIGPSLHSIGIDGPPPKRPPAQETVPVPSTTIGTVISSASLQRGS